MPSPLRPRQHAYVSPPPPDSLALNCGAWEYEGLALAARLAVIWALISWQLFVAGVCMLALLALSQSMSNLEGYEAPPSEIV